MRFLVVDDDSRILTLMDVYLTEYGDTVGAPDGKRAVESFKKALDEGARFDVVFMDITLPDTDGHKLVERMRKAEDKAGVAEEDRFKLVMITAHKDLDNYYQAFLDNFAAAYLEKPFTEEQLLEELVNKGVLPPPES